MKVVKRLIIAGGGTAGWIAASWFSRRWGNRMEVVVIDKSEPERVGVGEATLLSFPKVMRDMGYQEKEWMNEIDATFKAGILFPCLLYTSPSPRDRTRSRMPSSA